MRTFDSKAMALDVRDLAVDFSSQPSPIRALDGVSLSLAQGKSLAVVGESGSGKSTLVSMIGGLAPTSATTQGEVHLQGRNVFDLAPPHLRRIRRESLRFIAQDPIAALDPTLRIGKQMRLVAKGLRLRPRTDELEEMLDSVKIPDPGRALSLFPHQISGGMAQRVAIAMALLGDPDVLLADEPTAALDAQVREEVMSLLFSRAAEKNTSIVWLSHDLGSVARFCEDIAVMYAGRVVETGPTQDVLGAPIHPYTRALAGADPARATPGERLRTIAGSPALLSGASSQCSFAPRCEFATELCTTTRPETQEGPAGHRHLCLRADELSEQTRTPTSQRSNHGS